MNMYQQLLDQIAAAGGKATPEQKSEEKSVDEAMLDLIRKAAAEAGIDITVIGVVELEDDEEDDASECPFCGDVHDETEEEDEGFSDEFIGTLQQAAMTMLEAATKFKAVALKAASAELHRMHTIERHTVDSVALIRLYRAVDALNEGNPGPLLGLL